MKILFSAEELAVAAALAARFGWSLQGWIAVAALTEPMIPADGPVLGERELLIREFMRAQRQLRGIATNVNQKAAAINRVLAATSGGDAVAELVEAAGDLPRLIRAVTAVTARVRDAVIALQRERPRP